MKPANLLILLIALSAGAAAVYFGFQSAKKEIDRRAFGPAGRGAFGNSNYQWMSRQQLEAIVQQDSDNPLAAIQLARMVQKDGEADRARTLFKAGLEKVEIWIHQPGGVGDVKENWYHKGLALKGLDMPAEARKAFQRAATFQSVVCDRQLEGGRDRIQPTDFYNLACYHALASEHDEAIGALTRAVEFGFRDLDMIQRDEDLDALRSDERFAAVLQSLQPERADDAPPDIMLQRNGGG